MAMTSTLASADLQVPKVTSSSNNSATTSGSIQTNDSSAKDSGNPIAQAEPVAVSEKPGQALVGSKSLL